jgi:porin
MIRLRTEGDVEVSYQALLAPWWIVQPDLQIVLHPGGNIPLPGHIHDHPIPAALVLGFRSVVGF